MYRPNSRSQYQPRKRGFDDDNMFDGPRSSSSAPRRPMGGGPSSPVIPSGPELGATVKWFNSEKGFGFVEMADGSGDAFLHVNTLSTTGLDNVSPGATLRVRVGQGQKGPQVAEVLSVDQSTASPEASRRPSMGSGAPMRPRSGGMRREHDLSQAEEVMGTVKWYNPDKGFGFVTPQNGGKDVFIHASVLERSGMSQLSEGQVVQLQVVQGAKGPEAAGVSIG